ncbi:MULTISPECIES: MerR family transcriptional regulator [unclassified Streptomyces]|uniref:MerR family transcriptional regulator n=1 Tax=unclassified Streptomyces TaxID=2593676 RepID=UPI00099EAE47|nr:MULTISPECIES: MerR family transcriptional regulator [unclassified Streptomyces]
MRAGEAAAAAGVTIKALRYYEDCGLLSPGRAPNGYRDYTVEDVRLAEEIRSLGGRIPATVATPGHSTVAMSLLKW